MKTKTPDKTKWIRVTRRNPCPICNRPDWCGISADGQSAICMRVESSRQVHNGGWLHRLTAAPTPRPGRQAPVARPPPPDASPDWAALLSRFQSQTYPAEVARLAAALGLTTDSLRRLGIAWAAPHRAWAFPMRDADGELIGIRLRGEDGRKWCVTGSHQGLFLPVLPDGCLGDQYLDVVVCEGPTDTAAMLDWGFYAIGRPSCMGCEDMLVQVLARRNVVIMADKDEPKRRPDGTTWRPGQDGAHRLAERLFRRARSVKIILPLAGKDVRAWRQSGATALVVRAVMQNALYWLPTQG